MFYLIASVILATAFGLIMKHCQTRGHNVLAVGCVNYIAAGLVSGVLLLSGGIDSLAEATGQAADPVASPWLVLLLGSCGGASYVLSYLLILSVLKHRGITLPTAVTRLSIVIPILCSIALWGEKPNVWQAIGLSITFPALMLLTQQRRSEASGIATRTVVIVCVLLLLTSGGSRVMQKAFIEECGAAQHPLLIASWFGSAGVFGLVILGVSATAPKWRDLLAGTILGLVNFSALISILLALKNVPGFVFFPVSSAGSLALTALLASVIWRERLRRRGIVGIVAAVIACVALNIRNLG